MHPCARRLRPCQHGKPEQEALPPQTSPFSRAHTRRRATEIASVCCMTLLLRVIDDAAGPSAGDLFCRGSRGYGGCGLRHTKPSVQWKHAIQLRQVSLHLRCHSPSPHLLDVHLRSRSCSGLGTISPASFHSLPAVCTRERDQPRHPRGKPHSRRRLMSSPDCRRRDDIHEMNARMPHQPTRQHCLDNLQPRPHPAVPAPAAIDGTHMPAARNGRIRPAKVRRALPHSKPLKVPRHAAAVVNQGVESRRHSLCQAQLVRCRCKHACTAPRAAGTLRSHGTGCRPRRCLVPLIIGCRITMALTEGWLHCPTRRRVCVWLAMSSSSRQRGILCTSSAPAKVRLREHQHRTLRRVEV